MDQNHHHMLQLQSQKHKQLQHTLNNCLNHIFQIFKICHININNIQYQNIEQQRIDIIEYSNYIEKMLKKIINLLPKFMISIQIHNKFIKEFQEVNNNYQNMLKNQRDYKCQLNVLESRIAQVQKRQAALIQQQQKQKRYTKDFQRKLAQAKRQSQSKLDKFKQKIPIHSYQGEEVLRNRKNSLPSIIHHPTKINLHKHSHHLIGSPTHQEKTQRLVEHLRKKY